MSRVVALLRGINVGGHRVKMDALRGHFETMKFKNVETFIASGNVIFDTSATDLAALEQKIEKHLEKALGFEAATFIRTSAELEAVAVFPAFPAVAADHSLYVSFLRHEPDAATKRAVMALETEVDAFRVHGRELYWLCRGKISEVSLAWPKLEKLAKSSKFVSGTSRNITSVRKLVASPGFAAGS